jgi:hypothetical protein
MLFKGSFQVLRVSRFRHLGKGAQDFLFCKVDVLESLVKQLPQTAFARHRITSYIRFEDSKEKPGKRLGSEPERNLPSGTGKHADPITSRRGLILSGINIVILRRVSRASKT